MSSNPQLDLAYKFVTYTNKNIFLTGKAGTGKTTFLHNLKKSLSKRMAIVAPTGVAAINAGGVTIHSMFQLSFGPSIPNNTDTGNQLQRKFNKDKINLIRSLDLLVIDEISMVRADTLDAIDEVLRRYKNHSQPFGGVQLLMIGDLHQLSPVVKDEDWRILKDYYPNLYFFSSLALQKAAPISIELKHIYRQSDTFFIDLLNRVRENKIDDEVLTQLNQRYIPTFNPDEQEGYITLTTHNNTAQEINDKKLIELKTPKHQFTAEIKGDFPEYAYPTVEDLEIKLGAQVMFVKNDPSREKLFYNGKIGRIVKIEKDVIYVKCPDDYSEIAVTKLIWENIKYELNTDSKEVDEKVIGSFNQYPLKLAWAITIHKSQGLTFEKAIIDANAAFAHGQVYVALSRCKSFEGMVLRSPIALNSVKTDGTVAQFTKTAKEQAPNEAHLLDAQKVYQQTLITELFNFNSVKSSFYQCKKIAQEHYNTLPDNLLGQLDIYNEQLEKEFTIANKFKNQLSSFFNAETLPEENTELQERIKKASTYFLNKIESELRPKSNEINIDSDNKAVRTSIADAFMELQKNFAIKIAAIKVSEHGFNTISYLQAVSNVQIDFTVQKKNNPTITEKISNDIPHPELYSTIKKWRNALATENNVPVYIVLPQKALLDLLHLLPRTLEELETVKGIGKVKVKQYGTEILDMINAYCDKNDIERRQIEIPLKKEKVDTKKVSFDLYKAGKTIIEIAAERSFTAGTIEGHLAYFIITGEISIFEIVPKAKVAKIMAYIVQNPKSTSSETKIALGDDVSYGEIKAVMNHLEFINAEI